MIRDITLGQYYPTDSVLHRLDPRVKLFGTLIYVISLFLFQSFTGYIVATVFLVSMIALSHVPIKFIFRGLRAVLFILVFTAVLNVFLTPGRTLVSFWKITITIEGVRLAAFMILRLVYLIIGSSLMTLTTTPSNLTDGLEKSLGWLKIFRFPVHEIAMMMSIALTFIPVLLEETDRIIKAQQARGADFESGSIIRRAKSLVPILVPLFVSAFRRANDLAIAMESRCYHGGEGRTKMRPLKYMLRDYVAYTVLILYLAAVIVIGILF
ncbi:MAG: energy-coupling factor transporter transmembrane protein EcfT [Lachnospiraceae bacterium]|nr:energy-coupling factor transporter transmembrane protein EcfT [Lachnospiraceae bacterium]